MTDQPALDPDDFAPGVTTSARMLLTTLVVLGMIVAAFVHLAPQKTAPSPVDDVLRLSPSDDVQKAIDRAPPGAVIELARGEYRLRLRLENKRELELRGVEGAVLTHSEGQPLEIARDCRDIRLVGLEIRFAGAEQRTFPAMIVRDSTRVALVECLLSTTGGDGLVAERASALSLGASEVIATGWGLVLRGCEQLAITDVRLRGGRQGGVLATDCSGELRRLLVQANPRWTKTSCAVKASGRGQLTLVGGRLEGSGGGTGVWIAREATVAIEGGTAIARFKAGVNVGEGATLLGKGFAVSGNVFVGVEIEPRARMVRLLEVDARGQERPLYVGGDVPEHWEIAPGLLD